MIALAACTGSAGKRQSQHEERPRIGKVTRGPIIDRVLVTGALTATTAVELQVPRTDMWQLTIRWLAEDGAIVKKGDRALEFDNSQFTATLEQKKIALITAALEFNSYEDVSALDIAQKEFTLETHKIGLAKAKLLASVPPDLLPARTAQDRQLELKRVEAAAERAEKELASTKASNQLEKKVKQIALDKARAEIESTEKTIAELTMAAPREGVIVVEDHPWEERKFQVGDVAQPGMKVVTMPDPSSGMEVRGELSDVDDGRISVGMTGTCTLDAFIGDPVPCKVKDMMPVASGKPGASSLRRGFALVITLDRTEPERMRPGMSVKVELQRQPEPALVVPRGAVRWDRDKKARVQLAAGTARDVELGSCDAQVCAVKSGLADGDSVMIGGAR